MSRLKIFAFFVDRVIVPLISVRAIILTYQNFHSGVVPWLVMVHMLVSFAYVVLLLTTKAPQRISMSFLWILGECMSQSIFFVSFDARLLSPGILQSWIWIGTDLFANLFLLWGYFSLGRNLGITPAVRGLTTRWAFRFFRHPIYVGWTHIIFLMLVTFPSWQNAFLTVVFLIGLRIRTREEENLLKTNSAYLEYSAKPLNPLRFVVFFPVIALLIFELSR